MLPGPLSMFFYPFLDPGICPLWTVTLGSLASGYLLGLVSGRLKLKIGRSKKRGMAFISSSTSSLPASGSDAWPRGWLISGCPLCELQLPVGWTLSCPSLQAQHGDSTQLLWTLGDWIVLCWFPFALFLPFVNSLFFKPSSTTHFEYTVSFLLAFWPSTRSLTHLVFTSTLT